MLDKVYPFFIHPVKAKSALGRRFIDFTMSLFPVCAARKKVTICLLAATMHDLSFGNQLSNHSLDGGATRRGNRVQIRYLHAGMGSDKLQEILI